MQKNTSYPLNSYVNFEEIPSEPIPLSFLGKVEINGEKMTGIDFLCEKIDPKNTYTKFKGVYQRIALVVHSDHQEKKSHIYLQ